MSLSKSINNQRLTIGSPVNDELQRLASYLNWPPTAAVRPNALSRHGFTYDGEAERTRCLACGIVVDSWQRGDRPEEIHRRKSPRCPFVIAYSSSRLDVNDEGPNTLQRDLRNGLQQLRLNEPQSAMRPDGEIPTSTTMTSSSPPSLSSLVPATAAEPSVPRFTRTSSSASLLDRSRPDFVQLRSESARLSTFHDWPSSAGSIVEPRQLAAVGLFYTGQADRVQCAFCRGCLRSWKPGDTPAEEHRRYFPDCPFLRKAVTDSSPTALRQPEAKCTVAINTGNGEPRSATSLQMAADMIPASSSSSSLSAVAATAASAMASAAEDPTIQMDEGECL